MSFALLIVAASLCSDSPFPVKLVDGPVHLGERDVRELEPATASGLAWSGTFEVRSPAARHVLVLEACHVTSFNDPRYRKGELRDVVAVNDHEIGTINDSVEGQDFRPGRVEVAIPEGVVRAGQNTIRIESGAGHEREGGTPIHDEFSFGKVWLFAAVPVVVRPHAKGEATTYPITLAFESTDGDSGPILGPSFRAAGARRVAIDVTGETRAWLRSPGGFRVWAMRGPEYTAASATFSTAAGAPPPIDLEIERVIRTPGFVGADFHVHSSASFDCRMTPEDRVASCAAAGLDFFVASEHNEVVDLEPIVRKLGLDSRLRVCAGEEITTENPTFGHFNAFPLSVDSAKPRGGALPFEHAKPADLFAAAHARGPAMVLQVNHPRMGNESYFDVYQLDWAKVDGGLLRHATPGFATTFDSVEVMNGMESMEDVRLNLADWYRLLDDGLRPTATGNSDSHKIVFQEVGWPRNYVFVGGGNDDPAKVRPEDVALAVRGHRVSVSHGPIVRAIVAGRDAIGDDVACPDGNLDLDVRVDAAPWVRVDRVDVVVNGTVAASAPVLGSDVRRFAKTISLKLVRDSWIVVLAEGEKFDAPCRQIHALPPFAFTNPIWVSVKQ
ncbi:MAG: PHP domain-containing protein [Planctomycetes bacterium]|nr:PHP domain-containing protein [Planctomycetota bacterium]